MPLTTDEALYTIRPIREQNQSKVQFIGEVSERAINDVIDHLRREFGELLMDRVVLEIDSHGGLVRGWKFFIDAAREFVEQGKTLVTTTRNEAISAAALMLIAGEERVATAGARIHFHNCSVDLSTTHRLNVHQAMPVFNEAAKLDLELQKFAVQQIRVKKAGKYPPVKHMSAKLSDDDLMVLKYILQALEKDSKSDATQQFAASMEQDFKNRRHQKKSTRPRRTHFPLGKWRKFFANCSEADRYILIDTLFRLDATITPYLCLELGLIDQIEGDPNCVSATKAPVAHLQAAQWPELINREMTRENVVRHFHAFGQSGSGKTASAIKPFINAVAIPKSKDTFDSKFMFVIDPKKELYPCVKRLVDSKTSQYKSSTLLRIAQNRLHMGDTPMKINCMKSTDFDARQLFEAGQFDMLARAIKDKLSALGIPSNAATRKGRTNIGDHEHFDQMSGEMIHLALVFVLELLSSLRPRKTVRVDEAGANRRESSQRRYAPPPPKELKFNSWKQFLSEFYEKCGFKLPNQIATYGAEYYRGDDACEHSRKSGENSSSDDGLTGSIDFDGYQESLVTNVFALAEVVFRHFFNDDEDSLCPDDLLFGMMNSGHWVSDDLGRLVQAYEALWVKAQSGRYFPSVRNGVRSWLYGVGEDPLKFVLYFGVETCFWPENEKTLKSEVLDFDRLVELDSSDNGEVWVMQPGIDSVANNVVARAVKSQFFHAVLNNQKRAKGDGNYPLIYYVVDEAHRYITSGTADAETRFLDTCRSFGVSCFLATQGISSYRDTLRDCGLSADESANFVNILCNNTSTKFYFRTEDRETIERLRLVSPYVGTLRLTDIKPVSSLQVGKCFVSLPNGGLTITQLSHLD